MSVPLSELSLYHGFHAQQIDIRHAEHWRRQCVRAVRHVMTFIVELSCASTRKFVLYRVNVRVAQLSYRAFCADLTGSSECLTGGRRKECYISLALCVV